MSSSPRAKIGAAVASTGVLFLGWQVGTANGQATVGTPTTPTTNPVPTTAAAPGGRPTGAVPTTGSSGTRRGPGSQSGAGTGTGQTRPGGESAGGGSVSLSVPAGASGTFTGTAASHQFGSVTVTVTLSNGAITALKESVTSDGDHHSDQINARSVPQLTSAILAVPSGGSVSTISGATYTTKAYLTSLQSALDKA